MCGIAGIVGKPAEASRGEVERMCSYMPHRGPDDRGSWGEGDVCFGHLRLSIIDVTDAGHQPMFSHDERFAVVFNGEIFNYVELRAELSAAGATFRTTGDTEVIMEAYRAWGADCVDRFNGMWAFALWDRREKTLFAARDRFGVKPFYWRLEGKELAFASEMKALLKGGKGVPDKAYFYRFFDRRTPLGTDRTVFEGIRHLRPGHALTWREGVMSVRRFWEPDPERSRQRYDYRDPVATFRELMTDAVKLRLRSDVPLGVCLSGGIDSSVIATLMHSLGVTPKTFSVIYDEERYSERSFIEAVNERIGAEAHALTPTPDDFFPTLDRIVEHHDEPVRMPGCFSHWHVMRCASEHVTVVLDGQGADEVFGGYREYAPAYMASLLRDILRLRRPAASVADLRDALRAFAEQGGSAAAAFAEALLRLPPSALRSVIAREARKDALFSRDFIARHGESLEANPEEEAFVRRFDSPLEREMQRTFAETNLPMLLRYEDRNSMAFSLEARVPFLDYRVVEFAHGLPYDMKVKGGVTKRIVREAFKDLLPPSVLHRKDKKGFPTPTSVWFKGPLREEVEARLRNGAFNDAGWFDPAQVRTILDEHANGTADHERTIFRLLTLDVWLRKYV